MVHCGVSQGLGRVVGSAVRSLVLLFLFLSLSLPVLLSSFLLLASSCLFLVLYFGCVFFIIITATSSYAPITIFVICLCDSYQFSSFGDAVSCCGIRVGMSVPAVRGSGLGVCFVSNLGDL